MNKEGSFLGEKIVKGEAKQEFSGGVGYANRDCNFSSLSASRDEIWNHQRRMWDKEYGMPIAENGAKKGKNK